MTDSMKFGPEWLRNLSGDSCNSGGGGGGTANLITPRYHLAEHRYGREEMLALFDRNCKPPEALSTLQTLYVEKTQLPLAFIPMTEDETRVWNGGVSNPGGRGRGGSVDRGGRGRTGRGGMYSFSRGPVGFDDSGDGSRLDSQPYPGRRVYDRSQSERGWSERNGVSDTGEWNGSTSPRKEMSRGASGSSLMESNWRRHRAAGDEEEGWRSTSNNRNEKWSRSNWRDGERERVDRGENDGDEGRGGGRWETRASHRLSHDSHHHPPRTARTWESNHHDNHDNLPEWATENPSESGGSFDASGAFHGGIFSDEDEEGVTTEARHRRISEGNNNPSSKSSNKLSSYGPNVSRHSNSTSAAARERPKSLHPFDDKETSMNQERRSVSPTKPTSNTSSLNANQVIPDAGRKVQTSSSSANLVKPETNKVQAPQRSKSFIERSSKPPQNDSRPEESPALATTKSKPPSIPPADRNPAPLLPPPKPEDDLDRMNAEADMLVAKLTADEESHREDISSIPPVTNHQPLTATTQEKWFYRDPQGEVQGPFLANEMAEWCRAGYFTSGLLVRRICDERYATLGDLITMCGRVPFVPGHPIPPLKISEQVIPPPMSNLVPTILPPSALSKPALDDSLQMYQHLRLLQNQQALRQMKSAAFTKLSQSEQFATLSAVEQNQLVMQCIMQDSETRELPVNPSAFVSPLPQTPTNPVMQLFNQMQQAKTPNDTHIPPAGVVHPGQAVDTLQQFIQKIGSGPNLPPPQTTINAPPQAPQDDNPIKSLLRQLQVNANGHPQGHLVDSIWPQPPPQINPQFKVQNWLAQVGQLPPMPPGQMPNCLWDMRAKEMKTEQQILEEQNLKLQADRQKEELRRQEEILRQVEDETAKRKMEAEVHARQLEEVKRKDEEKKRREEEKKRKEDEKRKQEEELKKKEEKKRKDEERKREEKRKLDEENNRKKQEEEKKKREEAKRQEEKVKKEEERRRKLEEEQLRKQEEERLKKEEDVRNKLELEELARRAEQRRREVDALRKLQERSKAPWAQAQHAAPVATHASLTEIQRLEREKKAEDLRMQQQIQQQLAQQKTLEAAKEAAAVDSSKRLQFKWAEKTAPSTKQPLVKSLAQIQQEEQERIAKVKQQEKERLEKANQKEAAVVMQNAGIWGTASQSLNWAPSANSGGDLKGGKNWTGSGFWDEPVSNKPIPVAKSQSTTKINQSAAKTIVSPPQQQQNNNKVVKGKVKKEEEIVKKLFDNTAKTDDFQQWCYRTLCGLQPSVDIPTFIGFLKDIESAYEVKEYVRMYLGDSKQTTEFTKQFLEKRSKLRSAQRPRAEADDLCKPAPAVNPNAPMEFQEVKGKAKKPKKGKMCKVDNRILGFSVTAATDRINVGDRDYGEGV
ncbi:GRB10-interacting GYF protein 2-like [Diachasmimorpha longicaudata]|uniref:GRB10-interacting GYF protein 2-like n=1 Tax=Diachasmimorpha longicaudata TaxID=58733 RepID=UPI0030B8C564